jgi:hypothetical protein
MRFPINSIGVMQKLTRPQCPTETSKQLFGSMTKFKILVMLSPNPLYFEDQSPSILIIPRPFLRTNP